MRTKLFLWAMLAALLTGCKAIQIVDVDQDDNTNGTHNTGNPPSANGIDYTPRGGSGRVGGSADLSAICGTAVCPAQQPFWYSDHPELITVQGSTQGAGGFYVGMKARVHFVAAGTATLCIQPSLTQKDPRACYTWTATP